MILVNIEDVLSVLNHTFADLNNIDDTVKINLPKVIECEDAISREKIKSHIKALCNPYGKPQIDFEIGKKVIDYIDALPSVHPKAKMGK